MEEKVSVGRGLIIAYVLLSLEPQGTLFVNSGMEVDNYYQVLLFSYRLCQVVLNSYFCTSLLVFTLMRSAFRIPIIVPKLARRQLPWHPYGDNCSSLFTTWMLGDFILSYDGMIVGKPSRDTDLDVNPVRNKELSNMRSTNKDETVRLSPPRLGYLDA